MNTEALTFVALDLETTGLDPKKDSIIEIAAIRFQIDFDGNCFSAVQMVERSMLINPPEPISQEVTMITGITNEMLQWKDKWEDIKKKVSAFIGDSIIVGHNVLFDINVLESHGIDITHNTVLDTFELSEIFSQEAESLNLGFLASLYHLTDPKEIEHRALSDTRISMRLFFHYLEQIRWLEGKKKAIWQKLQHQDESGILHTLAHITRLSVDPIGNIGIFDHLTDTAPPHAQRINTDPLEVEVAIKNLSTDPNEEMSLIRSALVQYWKVRILVSGKSVGQWMQKKLSEQDIDTYILRPSSAYISIEYMRELLDGEAPLKRKRLILIVKLSFWLIETQTGLLEELKFYGIERSLLPIFRCQNDESCYFRDRYYAQIDTAPCHIAILSDIQGNEYLDSTRANLIKDLPLLEEGVRRHESIRISFTDMIEKVRHLQSGSSWEPDALIHVYDMLNIIESIYTSVPDRPTGPATLPPGIYGETYFFRQQSLWYQGWRWLVHATETLQKYWKLYLSKYQPTKMPREAQMLIESLSRSISILVGVHSQADTNRNIIINIAEEVSVQYIPRDVSMVIRPILKKSIAYGVALNGEKTQSFIEKECGIQLFDSLEVPHESKIIRYQEYHVDMIRAGTVILTTSQKHARDMWQELRKYHGKDMQILIQWLSGGRGKMLATFIKDIRKTILIGIIDTWKDEYSLWGHSKAIIIAKMPFDPPTDPYFLARTVGMSNNFSEYSEPIVVIRINTLISRIMASGFLWAITTSDIRIQTTEWWKSLQSELL